MTSWQLASYIQPFSLISDDPYYCGLRARIPNFVKTRTSKKKGSKDPSMATSGAVPALGKGGVSRVPFPDGAPISLPPQIPSHPFWWHSRLYNDAGHMSEFDNL